MVGVVRVGDGYQPCLQGFREDPPMVKTDRKLAALSQKWEVRYVARKFRVTNLEAASVSADRASASMRPCENWQHSIEGLDGFERHDRTPDNVSRSICDAFA